MLLARLFARQSGVTLRTKMAHPADIAPKAPAAFASGRLSPEEAERLASTFRPSWELDDAPFTGPGALSEADRRALQGGGTHADVRAVAQSGGHAVAHASNGAHAPPPPTQSHEPENSVIIDRSITADAPAAAAPKAVAASKPGATMVGIAPPPALQAAPMVAPAQPVPEPPQAPARPPLAPISRRPPAPAFQVPPARAKAVSVDVGESYPKKSKAGLWVGVGLGGLAAIGLVAWLAMSPGSSEKATAPQPTATKAPDDKLSAVPPPPPATVATADSPPPAAQAAAPLPTPAATPIPTTPVAALPQAVPTHAAAAFQPRPTYGGGGPAPRPAGKPKGGQTIVRDVPF